MFRIRLFEVQEGKGEGKVNINFLWYEIIFVLLGNIFYTLIYKAVSQNIQFTSTDFTLKCEFFGK